MNRTLLKNLRKGLIVPLFLAIYVLSLAAEVSHFVLIDHSFSMESAELVHSHEECEPVLLTSVSAPDFHEHRDDETTACSTVANLRKLSNSRLASAFTLIHFSKSTRLPNQEIAVLVPRAVTGVFHFAPKNSPPSVA